MRVRKQLGEYWNSFSFIGLVVATLFFAASVTPSLLPRTYYVQGILSGFAITVGYSLGVAFVLVYQFLELPNPSERIEKVAKALTVCCVAVITLLFLREMGVWQNSIRERMEMPMIESAYQYRTALIALVAAALLIGFFRVVIRACGTVARWLQGLVPRRVSVVLGSGIVGIALFFFSDGVVLQGLIGFADSFFQKADELIPDGVEPPESQFATGNRESKIDWESIGIQGKKFIAIAPTQKEITEFLGRDAKAPIRVYAGMRSEDTPEERAQLALDELIRVDAFQRAVLVVATPTGTGWLDPGAVDTLEFLHAGDTAIVSTQYSYLPSWITILIDPRRSIESADALFHVVYGHWRKLPKDKRPKLYLQGLSLGSLGSEVSADLVTMFEDPIHGSVWSGPPFPSSQWNNVTRHRNSDSPAWLPTFRDSRIVRFTSQANNLSSGEDWGPIRNVYIQYASDPMVFFSPSLLYEKPSWLIGGRGPDVSPYLTWYPIVTFLQVAFDLPMATSVPIGYGHNYSPAHYIDAWVAVTQPKAWSEAELLRLKRHFEK